MRQYIVEFWDRDGKNCAERMGFTDIVIAKGDAFMRSVAALNLGSKKRGVSKIKRLYVEPIKQSHTQE